MKKFKNIRPNDIIVVSNLTMNIYCVVKRIIKYDTENNTITLAITDLFTRKKYITPELYMIVCHIVDDKCNTYETTNVNIHTLSFMCAVNDEYLSDYDEALLQYKYNTIHTSIDASTYDRDNVDNRPINNTQNMLSKVFDDIIQQHVEMAGYYEYIQRVRPKRIEKIILHVV